MQSVSILNLFGSIYEISFSKHELLLLEADLLNEICHELKNFFDKKQKSYQQILKSAKPNEVEMIEANYIRSTLNDIINSGEYTLEGLATYTQIPEDVLYDIAIGKNLNPSLAISQKIIDLHKFIRSDLYNSLRLKLFNFI